MISSWYAGVRASAKDRLIVRNRVSLIFYLPRAYRQAIEQTPGVAKVAQGNWFGGTYRDAKFRFSQFAVDDNYLDVYPEFTLSDAERAAFRADRTGAIMGADVAERYGFKVADTIQLQGSIFPGMWQYTVHGIFHGRNENTITRQMLFHWDYLNERNRAEINRQPDHVGFFVLQLAPGANPAAVAEQIDARFANSFAETITESETAFQQSFVSMSSNIIIGLNIVSLVVLAIILMVLANTLGMAVRERFREYAILKALGFGPWRVAGLICGEACVVTLAGIGVATIACVFIFGLPPRVLLGELINFFPVFRLEPTTTLWALLLAALVTFLACITPAIMVAKLKVTDGLRRLG